MYKIKIFVRTQQSKFESYVKLYGYKNQSWIFVPRERAYNLYTFFDIHPVNDILNFTILKTEKNNPFLCIFSPNHTLQNFCYNQKEKIEKTEKLFLKRRIYGRGNFI